MGVGWGGGGKSEKTQEFQSQSLCICTNHPAHVFYVATAQELFQFHLLYFSRRIWDGFKSTANS